MSFSPVCANVLTIIDAGLATSVIVQRRSQAARDWGLFRLTKLPETLRCFSFYPDSRYIPCAAWATCGCLRETFNPVSHSHTPNVHRREKAGGLSQLRRVVECSNSWKWSWRGSKGRESLSLSLSLLSVSLSPSLPLLLKLPLTHRE